ncbi:hypothetical protein SAMN05444955_114111 [Lihuaxuella thermophila]|uniref:Uncharacterized protein n=1 Tax=Lihuaxuella thermophila TaxID=1173111 RepID=A0A1H8HP00_9BACL|nr:hypothetical protein SAMN05444955_114111 [Lihuaxuella thermophila]
MKKLVIKCLYFYLFQLSLITTGYIVGVFEIDFLGILLIPLLVTAVFFVLNYIKNRGMSK